MSHRLHTAHACLLASALASAAVLADGPVPTNTPAAAPAAQRPTAAATSKPTASATSTALDLHAPPVERVLPPEQIRSMIADRDEPAVGEDVRVEGTHYRDPVPGGLFAIPWAILHPTQAWRIFTPVTD